jgi:GxxExxY protein
LESVYESCLEHRLVKLGLNVRTQKPIPVVFEEVKLECGFRCDLLVEEKLIIEVKSCEALNDIHLAQVLTYLRLSDKRLELLMNFNVLKLKDGIKRVVNNL